MRRMFGILIKSFILIYERLRYNQRPITMTTVHTDYAKTRAIVVGGSIAGLLAARVLADHINEVIILEKDILLDQPVSRRGIPQSEQLHSIHQKGAEIIQELFPDLAWDFETSGVVPCDLGSEMRWFFFGEWMEPARSDIFVHWCERPRLEWQIRRRVTAFPNVRIVDGCKVTTLLHADANSCITGVVMRTAEDPHTDQTLVADLVVDACGRGSRVDQWLTDLGYPEASEEEVKIDLGYACGYYQLPDDMNPAWKALLISAKPGLSEKLGLIYRMPNNQIKASMAGWFGDHPPADQDEFLAFARSLPQPDMYELLCKATPLTPIRTYKMPSNQWRRYDKQPRWPVGLFVIGDAVCSFNPSFGQGMTVAALQAVKLGELYHEQKRGNLTAPGLAHRFQKEAARIVNNPWMITTGEDLRFAKAEGPRPFSLSVMHRYLAQIFEIAHYNPAVAKQFFEVMTFLKKPSALFQPAMLLLVSRHVIGKMLRKPAMLERKEQRPATQASV